MPRSPRAAATPSRDALHLLALLCQDGAFAARLDEDKPTLAVAARRNGIMLRIGAAKPEAAKELASAGLAHWDTGGSRPRLVATEAGEAAARRHDAARKGVDPFQAQHCDIVLRSGADGDPTQIDETESPLAWLSRRRGAAGAPFLGAHEVEAGERLRRDATFAQIMPGVTMNWSGAVATRGAGARGLDPTETMISARQRLDRALRMAGPDFAGLLLDICVFLKRLETVEKERGWPARSAKIVLRLALSQLARHYGLGAEARSEAAPLRSWGAADYRPRIDGEIVQA